MNSLKSTFGKSFTDLVLQNLLLFSSLFIPGEVIITRFRIDETSIELVPWGFETILYGYESKIIILFVTLAFVNQLLFFCTKSISIEFLSIFLVLVHLALTTFFICLHTNSAHIGFYTCLISSGLIQVLIIRNRFFEKPG